MRRPALLAMVIVLSFAAPSRSDADTRPVPDAMQAAAFDKGGGPEVLSIHRLPVPKPKAGEVLIAVHAAGVAIWEAGMRQDPGKGARFPVVLGGDGAGTIVAVGPDVHGFKVGDEVYGTANGFYAEYVKARADRITHIPKGVNLTEASILAISGLSAIQGIDDMLQLKAGETLIIHGAAGGVGTLAIQLAKLRGAKVLATASNEEGVALASKLGADAVVNGRTGDITAAAKQFAPNGVDAVLGLAGGDSLERCIDVLRSDGQGRVAYLYGMEPLPRPRFGIRMTLYSFLKPNHVGDDYPASVINEYLVMSLANKLGIRVPPVFRRYTPEPVYIVERFDRHVNAARQTQRRHIIDACQLLNKSRAFKYRNATLQTLTDIVMYCRNRASTRMRLYQWLVFNLLVANNDNHLKNLSFTVSDAGVELSPAYDLLSTGTYHTRTFAKERANWPNVELAITLPGATTFDAVTRESVLSSGEALGLPRRLGERELDRLTRALSQALDALARDIKAENASYPEAVLVYLGGETRLLSTLQHLVVPDMLKRVARA